MISHRTALGDDTADGKGTHSTKGWTNESNPLKVLLRVGVSSAFGALKVELSSSTALL